MARDLVRTRANIQKFHRMKSQLQAVSLRIQTIRSTAAMANAMAGAARVKFFFFLLVFLLFLPFYLFFNSKGNGCYE